MSKVAPGRYGDEIIVGGDGSLIAGGSVISCRRPPDEGRDLSNLRVRGGLDRLGIWLELDRWKPQS